jgi:hypothetical protein
MPEPQLRDGLASGRNLPEKAQFLATYQCAIGVAPAVRKALACKNFQFQRAYLRCTGMTSAESCTASPRP